MLFSVRCQAMTYAMNTATAGEDLAAIMARAFTYMTFMSQPLLDKTTSDQMGEVGTTTVQ